MASVSGSLRLAQRSRGGGSATRPARPPLATRRSVGGVCPEGRRGPVHTQALCRPAGGEPCNPCGPSPPGPSQADPDRSSEEQSSAPYESQIICPTGSCPNAGLRSHELLQRADGWQLRTPDFSKASNGLCSQAEVPALSAEAPSPCPSPVRLRGPRRSPAVGVGGGGRAEHQRSRQLAPAPLRETSNGG